MKIHFIDLLKFVKITRFIFNKKIQNMFYICIRYISIKSQVLSKGE